MAGYTNVRIGDVLKDYGYISDQEIEEALEYQKEHQDVRMGSALIEMGFITEKQMLQALAVRLNLKQVDLGTEVIDTAALEKIPQALAEKYLILALREKENVLTVAVNDPLNFYALEDIRQLTGMETEIMLCEREPLGSAIRYYYSEISARRAAKAANDTMEPRELEEIRVEEGDGDTPIIHLLDSLIRRAYNINASDIHIEPFEDKTLVRMRIDGTITDYVSLQKKVHPSLVARVKILSDLDIAEHRIPQDGHCRVKVDNMGVNIRVSVIPTVFGEKAVLRLLVENNRIERAQTFGMDPENCEKFRKMLAFPYGMIYLTGPTGSGKSTTLYMALEELTKRQVNISTIEDPVEKHVARVNQMQVNRQAGLTFETGLRALLRQDPDIIMVGETRDSQTAQISVRAAITGHLVLSTLHTNDAVSSIVRLLDLGLEPYLLANSLAGLVAQRLVRKVCPYCGEEIPVPDQDREFLDGRVETVRAARGCRRCNYTGYSGRIAIHEMVVIDQELRRMINQNASISEITRYAVEEQGMKTLRQSGIRLVEQGITTVEELRRAAYFSD